MDDYQMQLTREVAFVSIAMLPIYLTTDTLLGFIKNDKWRTILSVMISGGLLHLGSEVSGINQWYLEHSAISMKMKPIEVNASGQYEISSGVCGATSCPLQPDDINALII